MNQAGSYTDFRFVDYQFGKYRYTDARGGADRHYLAVLEEGHCKLVSRDTTLEIRAGEAFYIPIGLPYQSYWHGVQIRFRSYGFPYFPEAEHQSFALQKLPEAAVSMIRDIPLQRRPNSAGLNKLYAVLEQLIPDMTLSSASHSQQLYQRALDHMYDQPKATNAELARYCCISNAALYTLFRRETGRTPNEIRQSIAVKKAVQLLTTTDLPVQRISDDLGFSSASYFRKILKKHTDKTPRQIRKEAKTL